MKYLLPDTKNRYKANLHCHTTLSDGSLSPEAVRDAYMAQGYRIVAFTDHDRYCDHSDFCTDDFLALNAFEADISDWEVNSGSFRRCYHLNAYHKKPIKELNLPVRPPYRDIEAVNRYVQTLRDMDFLVAYNHPYWSMQTRDDYKNLQGLFAMEIFNYSAMLDGTDSDQVHVYDEMLALGNRLFCTMTDDNHNRAPALSPKYDSFGGFTVVAADDLHYDTIIKALENGDLYCSQGPEIQELTMDGDTVSVKCSPAQRITFRTLGRRGLALFPEEGQTITEGSFKLQSDDVCVRVEIVAPDGKKANSNAYFLDAILK